MPVMEVSLAVQSLSDEHCLRHMKGQPQATTPEEDLVLLFIVGVLFWAL